MSVVGDILLAVMYIWVGYWFGATRTRKVIVVASSVGNALGYVFLSFVWPR